MPHHPLRMARFGFSALESAQHFAKSHFSNAAHARSVCGPRRALLPELRRAAERNHRMDVRHHDSCGGLADTARRRAAPLRTRSPVISNRWAARCTLRTASTQQHSKSSKQKAIWYSSTPRRGSCWRLPAIVSVQAIGALRAIPPGPGAFKIDYALSEPVPWRAQECRRAITVHLGGTFEEIAASEYAVAQGRCAERPFVLAAQPTLFDPTRAPAGKHVLWAYCHVPNGATFDIGARPMEDRIDAQIERFAPGFRDCILARHVSTPATLETMDANLLGGDIAGGALSLRQMIFRPTLRGYATGIGNLYLCSASTPPGGGVHGMCGYHAAQLALRQMKRS